MTLTPLTVYLSHDLLRESSCHKSKSSHRMRWPMADFQNNAINYNYHTLSALLSQNQFRIHLFWQKLPIIKLLLSAGDIKFSSRNINKLKDITSFHFVFKSIWHCSFKLFHSYKISDHLE